MVLIDLIYLWLLIFTSDPQVWLAEKMGLCNGNGFMLVFLSVALWDYLSLHCTSHHIRFMWYWVGVVINLVLFIFLAPHFTICLFILMLKQSVSQHGQVACMIS